MTKRNFVAPMCLGLVVQRAAPHPGAEAAGVFLLADVKDDLPNIGSLDDVLDPQGLAELFNGGIVHFHTAKPGVQSDRNKFIVNPDKTTHLRQTSQQHHAVLST